MSLSILGDSAIFFETSLTAVRNIGDVNTRVTCENMNEASTENFNQMICLLFIWVQQLASVMYPANHSCLIQNLGLYICKKSNNEYSLDRIQEYVCSGSLQQSKEKVLLRSELLRVLSLCFRYEYQ